MTLERDPWYAQWFGEEYLALYPERDDREARQQAIFARELLAPFARVGRMRFLDLACGTGRHAVALHDGLGGCRRPRPLGAPPLAGPPAAGGAGTPALSARRHAAPSLPRGHVRRGRELLHVVRLLRGSRRGHARRARGGAGPRARRRVPLGRLQCRARRLDARRARGEDRGRRAREHPPTVRSLEPARGEGDRDGLGREQAPLHGMRPGLHGARAPEPPPRGLSHGACGLRELRRLAVRPAEVAAPDSPRREGRGESPRREGA